MKISKADKKRIKEFRAARKGKRSIGQFTTDKSDDRKQDRRYNQE